MVQWDGMLDGVKRVDALIHTWVMVMLMDVVICYD